MNNRLYSLLLACLFCLPAFCQTGTSGLLKPTEIISFEKDVDKVRFTCNQGFIEISFPYENIAHFVYYPKTSPYYLPSWGILPSDTVIDIAVTTKWETVSMRTNKLLVKIDSRYCLPEFADTAGNVFLSAADYHLAPLTVSGETTARQFLSFSSRPDEAYYGLGQNQAGDVNLRGKDLPLWHNYADKKGEVIAIPFLLSSKGYGIIVDNTSKSMVKPGVNGKTDWHSEVADAVSFYVLYGNNMTDLYSAYRKLCGTTPLLPKAAYGYIQCKERYKSQEELLAVARTYREKKYPADYLVVDWYHWGELGDLDFNKKPWPDPAAMNAELKALNFKSMISCWPRFTSKSKNYNLLQKNGWFMKRPDAATAYGTINDQRGALIDVTNPDASRWFWNTINKNYNSYGFTSWWLDENEPDVSPHSYYYHAGTGARLYNLYPYLETKAVYEGARRDLQTRALILSRSAYLGANQFGTTFWSSDIKPYWDVLRRQVSAGINFCASGFPYWSSDIGGWSGVGRMVDRPKVAKERLLIQPDNNMPSLQNAPDYTEMYIRWFQFGSFCPTFRAHGQREQNEVWSYGKEAEQILVKYLKLRYRLLPYIYSSAHAVTETGEPLMRGLFLDFAADKKVADIKDQYLFCPSFLVAPVVTQGQQKRTVYLPESSGWYDFWTNTKYKGGTTIEAASPIDKLPLFVKAGSIIPMGSEIQYATQKNDSLTVFVYAGADGKFSLYDDDGDNYEYEKGAFSTIPFEWNDKEGKLTIGDRKGSYSGMMDKFVFTIKIIGGNKKEMKETVVVYEGKAINYSNK